MRAFVLAGLAMVLASCGERGAFEVGGPESAQLAGGQRRSAAASVNPPGLGGRPVDGTGTSGRVAQWGSTTQLTDAPIRIDSAGNVLLKPGSSLFVIAADGSRCVEIAGDHMTMHKTTAGCPVKW